MQIQSNYLFLLLLLVACFIQSCHKTPDEQKIRQIITEIEEAVSTKDSKLIISHLAPIFVDKDGRDIKSIQAYIRLHFLRNKNINVVNTTRQIQITGDMAYSVNDVVISGAQNLIPDRVEYFVVDLSWKKFKGKWLITEASWRAMLVDSVN